MGKLTEKRTNMRTRNKRIILIILCALALCLTLIASTTIAYYSANRKATATIVMDKGIFFEFGNVYGEDKERELLLTTDEVMSVSIVPNQVVEIKNPYIKPLTNTVAFYLRAKLEYKYYSGDTEIFPADEEATLSELLVLDDAGNAFTFADEFLPDLAGEWFYYCANDAYATAGKNQLTALTEESAKVDIFASTGLTVQNFTGEFGSPNEVSKIEVVLVVETLQAEGVAEYGLPDDGTLKQGTTPTATTINLKSGAGNLTYVVDGSTVEITELSVADAAVISEEDMSFADGKTLEIDPLMFEGLTEMYVYDKELLDYFAFYYYPNGLGEVNIYTSEELFTYLEGTPAFQFLYSYIIVG